MDKENSENCTEKWNRKERERERWKEIWKMKKEKKKEGRERGRERGRYMKQEREKEKGRNIKEHGRERKRYEKTGRRLREMGERERAETRWGEREMIFALKTNKDKVTWCLLEWNFKGVNKLVGWGHG